MAVPGGSTWRLIAFSLTTVDVLNRSIQMSARDCWIMSLSGMNLKGSLAFSNLSRQWLWKCKNKSPPYVWAIEIPPSKECEPPESVIFASKNDSPLIPFKIVVWKFTAPNYYTYVIEMMQTSSHLRVIVDGKAGTSAVFNHEVSNVIVIVQARNNWTDGLGGWKDVGPQ